ncbi:MAG: DUF3450 family protein [Puniceicoccales bacterium]
MNTRLIAICGMLSVATLSPLSAQNDSADAKAKLSKWVETRQIISKERTEWDAEQEFLKSTLAILQDQAKALTEEVAELQDTNTEADKERNTLQLEKAEYQRAINADEAKVAELEQKVLKLVEKFPEPLKRKLDSLIVRIPEDPSKSNLPLGSRLTHVLGILQQAEKFNSTTNFFGETREVGNQEIMVSTLYWGLAFAVFVDSKGTVAGVGVPGPDGWVWEENNAIAGDVRRFIDIYEGNTDVIEFVALPITIK